MSSHAALQAWSSRPRVLLADTAGFSRTALADVLTETAGVELVGVAADGWGLREALRRVRPDVVVVDDRLLQEAHWLWRDRGLRVIVVGVDDDPGYAARARRLGAVAWIPKERADLLIAAIVGGEVEG